MKSNNTFIFRNNIDVVQLDHTNQYDNSMYLVTPKGLHTIDTYLIHQSDVSFTLSTCGGLTDRQDGVTPASSIAYSSPMDYGKEGDLVSPQTVILRQRCQLAPDSGMLACGELTREEYANLGIDPTTDNLEFIFPVTGNTSLDSKGLNQPIKYPIIGVQYVEIKGNPTNIEATL